MMDAAGAVAPYIDYLERPAEDVVRDLEAFAAFLFKWNASQNLVSRETDASGIWQRHIADSLQVLKLLQPSDRFMLDVGSGGGFPAIPLAISSDACRHFWLVEPIAKKASFLRAAAREIGLKTVHVEQVRVERMAVEVLPPINVITSRALAPLPLLIELVAPFFRPTTRAILHKGREHVDELAESRAVWQFDVLEHPSDTEPSGVLLEISNLRYGATR